MSQPTYIWNKHGRVAILISGNRIFDAQGREVGWVEGENVYDRTGRHIAWFVGGILRDSYGKVLGFSEHIKSDYPHPEFPREREGAPPVSLEGKRIGKPGPRGAPGRPLIGGKPPLGAAWSNLDAEDYFMR